VTLDTIDIDATLSEVERLLKEDKTLSPVLNDFGNCFWKRPIERFMHQEES
jgi:hypothetical protein